MDFIPAEARQPHCEQSGSPPNWHGVIRLFRSAVTDKVVRAKMAHEGIILLRLGDERAANKIAVLERLLNHHGDRLVGRFDPKLERKTGTLRLKALHLEPGIVPDEELVADVAAAMRDFLAFHGAKNLIIEQSQPGEFGEKLLAKI